MRQALLTAMLTSVLALSGAPLRAQPQCSWEETGQRWGVHPQLLYAIAKVESGLDPKARNRNKNGSEDIGLMQINSSWLPRLKKEFGIDRERLLEPCISLEVAGWILWHNRQQLGDTWNAVGAYNARSEHLRLAYVQRIHQALLKAPPARPAGTRPDDGPATQMPRPQ